MAGNWLRGSRRSSLDSFSGRIIFATTTERRVTILNHNRARGQVRERATEGWPDGRGNGNDRVKWLGFTRINEKMQGYSWASQAAMDFQIPSQASLRGIVKSPSLILLRKWPCFALESSGKSTGLRFVSKRGDVVKKHPQARLRVSYPQQIQHSRS